MDDFLKQDDYTLRKNVKKQRVFPDDPLTKKEREDLTEKYLRPFISHYLWQMEKSKCFTSSEVYELQQDRHAFDGEACEFFIALLDRFDKAKKLYEDQPMEEFFEGFYKKRIHNRAGEIVKNLKNRGKPIKKPIKKKGKTKNQIQKEQDHYEQLVSNWERSREENVFELPALQIADEKKSHVFNELWVEDDKTQFILNKLKEMPTIYQRWFCAKYKYYLNYPELRLEFKDHYDELKVMDKEFIEEIRQMDGGKYAA